MDKYSYKLLKKLYKSKMDLESINRLTKHTEKRYGNPHVSYLQSENLIILFSEGGRIEGDKIIDGKEWYKISLLGRDYVERSRRELLNFWLPYGITTIIAIASLVVSFVSLLHQCSPPA